MLFSGASAGNDHCSKCGRHVWRAAYNPAPLQSSHSDYAVQAGLTFVAVRIDNCSQCPHPPTCCCCCFLEGMPQLALSHKADMGLHA